MVVGCWFSCSRRLECSWCLLFLRPKVQKLGSRLPFSQLEHFRRGAAIAWGFSTYWECGYLRLAASPHALLPLLLWLKLGLAYLTQAYVDFNPRQSEAAQAFEAGALLFLRQANRPRKDQRVSFSHFLPASDSVLVLKEDTNDNCSADGGNHGYPDATGP